MMIPRPSFNPPRRSPAKASARPVEPLKTQTPRVPRPRAIGGAATILLVDDDPAVLESLRRVFATEGLQVIAAGSGEEALACIERQTPDLIITDLCMATVTGWDLLYHESFERPGVPCFVISALPPKTTGGADVFATKFFQKPLDLEALLAAVHAQLGTHSSATDQNRAKNDAP